MLTAVEALRTGDILFSGFTVTGAPVVNDQNGVKVPLKAIGDGMAVFLSAMVGDERDVMYSSALDQYFGAHA